MSIAQRNALIDALVDWYWQDGRRREPTFRLSPDWIIDIYKHRDTGRALAARSATGRRTVAIWGPSQAGKSTMLSHFLDDAAGPGSALNWPNGAPFRFQRDVKAPHIGAYNPYHLNSDASGCVTNFVMVDQVRDPIHPVTITFLSRAQVMQAIAAGYLWECKLETPQRSERFLNEDEVRAMLARYGGGERMEEAERQAVEFLVDVVGAAGRLIEDGTARWRNLSFNNIWNSELVRAIFAAPALVARPSEATAFAYDLLWDAQPALNRLFESLIAYAADLDRRFGGKPVTCSLAFAAMLVDIDSYTSMVASTAGSEPGKAEERRRQLASITVRDLGDRVAIGVGDPAGQRLFTGDPNEFGLFQALVWELGMPLSADYLRGRSPVVAQFFERANVLDVPGVSNFERGEASTLVDLESPRLDASQLLTRVLKRGKTFTIINRYAHELRVDLLLLLARVMRQIPKTEQLIAGTRAIWREIDRSYDPSREQRPPVPVVLGMTFMAQLFQSLHAAGLDQDLMGIEKMVDQLGPIANPNVCDMLATTYPQYFDGRIQLAAPERARVLDALRQKSWIRRHFRPGDADASLEAAMQHPDGGVSHLLTALTARLAASQTETQLRQRFDVLLDDVNRRIEHALPIADDGGSRHREAIASLAATVQERLDASVDDGIADPAIEVSKHLRRLMAFDERVFENVPLHIGRDPIHDREALKVYLDRQLGRWTERPEASDALSRLGLAEEHHAAVLHALRENVQVDVVLDWAGNRLTAIESELAARQARRYIAARCAETLLERPPGPDTTRPDPSSPGFQDYLTARFADWTAPGRKADQSPHYAKIIEPILDSLVAVANRGVELRWSPQPGDEVILALAEAWRTAEMKESANGKA